MTLRLLMRSQGSSCNFSIHPNRASRAWPSTASAGVSNPWGLLGWLVCPPQIHVLPGSSECDHRTSLVAQSIGVHLPMQGTRV